jgi:hypothetical protein
MILDQYNPINKQNLGWAVAAFVALQHYPRLAGAMAKSGLYLGLTPFRETYNVAKIFVKEFSKPATQIKPIISKSSLRAAGSRAMPAIRFVGSLAKRPDVLLASAAVAVTTYGMVKQNPPPLNTNFVMGGPM